MTAKKPKPEPDKPTVITPPYPSAPTDPTERRAFMRRRNAAIAKVDEQAYLEAIAAQDERVKRHGDELKRT